MPVVQERTRPGGDDDAQRGLSLADEIAKGRPGRVLGGKVRQARDPLRIVFGRIVDDRGKAPGNLLAPLGTRQEDFGGGGQVGPCPRAGCFACFFVSRFGRFDECLGAPVRALFEKKIGCAEVIEDGFKLPALLGQPRVGHRFGRGLVADDLARRVDDQAFDLVDRPLGDGVVGTDRDDPALLMLDPAGQVAAGGEEVDDAPSDRGLARLVHAVVEQVAEALQEGVHRLDVERLAGAELPMKRLPDAARRNAPHERFGRRHDDLGQILPVGQPAQNAHSLAHHGARG